MPIRLTMLSAIRASHILPWKDATSAERLDPNNGLPLVATIDALFDAGLISFQQDGAIIISDSIPPAERKRLSIHAGMAIGELSPKMERYMSQHRLKHFPPK
jgi:predicted restriction endonuclease